MNAVTHGEPLTDEALGRGVLLVSVDRAAEMLGIGRTATYGLVARGELPAVRIGRSRRVAIADLVEFVERLRVGEDTANG
jgi:excisionase family DNA binding protein